MEYLAKIIGEEKCENLWKYKFLNLEDGEKGSFYHSQKLNHISILPIRLELAFNEEQQVNFLQSFEQNIDSYIESSRVEKALTELLGKSSQVIENLSLKKQKIKLTPQLIEGFEKERINGKKITQEVIARITGYCERTIRYRKKQNNKPLQKRGRKRIMDEDTRAFLYLDFLNDNAKTQQERANRIYREKGIKISQQVVSYNLKKDISFTRKKGAKRYSGLKMEEVRQFLSENGWLYSLPNCLALDEFPTHLGEAPQYAWSREGCPAEIVQSGQKVATFTVIVCIQNIDKQGIIKCEVIKNKKKKIKDKKTGKVKIKKGTSAIDIYNFLKGIVLPTNEQYYLLLDNAKIHKTTKDLEELGLSMEELAKQKNITLVYLPRYAPQIDPVELCNNFIRGRIKSEQPRTEETLRKVIKEAVDFLNNKKDLTDFFRHCRDFFYVVKNGK